MFHTEGLSQPERLCMKPVNSHSFSLSVNSGSSRRLETASINISRHDQPPSIFAGENKAPGPCHRYYCSHGKKRLGQPS